MFFLFYSFLLLHLLAHRFPIFVVFVLLFYGGGGVLRMKRVKGRSVFAKSLCLSRKRSEVADTLFLFCTWSSVRTCYTQRKTASHTDFHFFSHTLAHR